MRGILIRIVAATRGAPVLPSTIVGVFIGLAIFADFLPLHSPTQVSLDHMLQPPVFITGGTWGYPLGTDAVGRDVLSRLIYGARASFVVAALALVAGAGLGTIVALTSAYLGRRVDAVLMRVIDMTLSLPMILLALLLLVVFGTSFQLLIAAISMTLWARFARLLRGEAMAIMQKDFVARARMMGCGALRIMVKHLFPNVRNTLMVLMSLLVGWVILVEASLSFLGLGIPPPQPSWGNMIADGRSYFATAWWICLFPGLAMWLVVLSFNLAGDWLRDALDPKLRQV